MREMIKMVVVLTILSTFSGGLLAAIRIGTKDKIEYQQLQFVKGPAIKAILSGSSNDPIVDRFKITDGDVERSFFVGVFDGKAQTVAFESAGKGFGGDIGLMIGVDAAQDKLVGIGVTTHSETPGVGSKTKDDPAFGAQFKGLPIDGSFKVRADGGTLDAISGATISSKGVCTGIAEAAQVYQRLKPQITEQLKAFAK
jgi:H+/Na+-translocating ferredoxin:NAD+ oxidoreductase subunit G